MVKQSYDVVIIGSGPAGMFAAHELLKEKNIRVLIIDEGKDIKNRKCPMGETIKCAHCTPCNIMCGVGGSGTFSDGTLNLRPDVGGDLTSLTKDERLAWDLIDEVDKTLLKFGTPKRIYGRDKKGVTELKRKAASVGVKFIEIPQRHIGTDRAPRVIERFAEYLRKNGIKFLLQTRVEDVLVKDGVCKGVRLKNGKEIKARYVIIAPGRIGAPWLNKLIDKHKIKAKFGPIDVGVRVEVSSIIMDPVVKINRDPKFHIRTRTYDDFVRTFCMNHEGFVVKENYDGFVGVNGHSRTDKKSNNSNFAFLVRVTLTKPVENTIKYGKSIAKLATTIGGGEPILQRIGDLRRGRRSHRERILQNPVQNTLRDVTPGDISMALPHRIVTDILEGLEKLNEVIPGVASDSTLLYAPEIKFYATQVSVDKNMETSVKNLFAAGDGAGLSRDIVNAAATGILAGRGILRGR
ncbi:MAG: FAD-dependent oxidoreductase [Candidatus Altiarchaeales archaeon]|nr:MAG: FAD-dependent oxidoreductase [Candidatus Altiarchaeales archaeon]HDI73244.1 NAD(P)/FAD-dependent oxidoreductase [Candidatus Altiarchaeales archaeon]